MTFSDQELSQIPLVLSQPRFATYLRHCENDEELALRLYRWNLELSSAFIVPLHLVEVSTRNAIAQALGRVHNDWPQNTGFIRSLAKKHGSYRPRQDLQAVAGGTPTPPLGKVVAALKFVFWEKMLTTRHNHKIWNDHIKEVFPFAPEELTSEETRKQLYDGIHNTRKLRNRIAHHEPIFGRDLQSDYQRIFEIITWRDEVAADWMDNFQTVTHLIREKPDLPR
jgi:hypothetical protein